MSDKKNILNDYNESGTSECPLKALKVRLSVRSVHHLLHRSIEHGMEERGSPRNSRVVFRDSCTLMFVPSDDFNGSRPPQRLILEVTLRRNETFRVFRTARLIVFSRTVSAREHFIWRARTRSREPTSCWRRVPAASSVLNMAAVDAAALDSAERRSSSSSMMRASALSNFDWTRRVCRFSDSSLRAHSRTPEL